MKVWMISGIVGVLIALSMFTWIILDIRKHPERNYSVACAPASFVRKFDVGDDTYAVCGTSPFKEVADFKIIKIP